MNFNIWRNFHIYVLASILTLIIVAQNGCALKAPNANSTGIFFSDIGSFNSEEEALFKGWEYFKNKDYEKANVIFSYLVNNSSQQYKEDSLAGLGWVNLRNGDSSKALSYFQKATDSIYSTLGMAVYYLLNDDVKKNIPQIINQLNKVIKNADVSKLKEFIGVNESQLNALIGYFYALSGDTNSAVSYAKKAKALDETSVRSILDSISAITGVEL